MCDLFDLQCVDTLLFSRLNPSESLKNEPCGQPVMNTSRTVEESYSRQRRAADGWDQRCDRERKRFDSTKRVGRIYGFSIRWPLAAYLAIGYRSHFLIPTTARRSSWRAIETQ